MAEHDPRKVAAILKDYEEALETLTFNSKPLINDLTMAADRYKPLAAQIVGKIESRVFEVFTSFVLFLLFNFCTHLFTCMHLLDILYQLREMLRSLSRHTWLLPRPRVCVHYSAFLSTVGLCVIMYVSIL